MQDAPESPIGDQHLRAGFASVVVFAVGILGWAFMWPAIYSVFDEGARHNPGEDGMVFLAIAALTLMGACPLLLLAVVLSLYARRLPRWFRTVTIISPAAGLVVGLAILYRAITEIV